MTLTNELCKFCDGSGEGFEPDSRCPFCSFVSSQKRLYEEYGDREEEE